MSGHYICYELATPQTYQLTPTEITLLKGQNNVWTDSGEVEEEEPIEEEPTEEAE